MADGWDLDVETIEYAPIGFGSYHWVATDITGTRQFVTVDDLDLKPWLGEGGRAVFQGPTLVRLLRWPGLARVLLNVDAENVTGATAVYEGVGMRVVNRWEMWERAAANS